MISGKTSLVFYVVLLLCSMSSLQCIDNVKFEWGFLFDLENFLLHIPFRFYPNNSENRNGQSSLKFCLSNVLTFNFKAKNAKIPFSFETEPEIYTNTDKNKQLSLSFPTKINSFSYFSGPKTSATYKDPNKTISGYASYRCGGNHGKLPNQYYTNINVVLKGQTGNFTGMINSKVGIEGETKKIIFPKKPLLYNVQFQSGVGHNGFGAKVNYAKVGPLNDSGLPNKHNLVLQPLTPEYPEDNESPFVLGLKKSTYTAIFSSGKYFALNGVPKFEKLRTRVDNPKTKRKERELREEIRKMQEELRETK